MQTLETSIEYLKGIGPERAKIINSILEIKTIEDFINFFPIRYVDKSKIYKINEILNEFSEIQLKGKIIDLRENSGEKGKRLHAKFTDGTGVLDLVWFQYSKWLRDQIPLNRELIVFGKISVFNQQFSMSHPEISLEEANENKCFLEPIYSSSEKLTKRGLNQKFFQTISRNLIAEFPLLLKENLPDYLLKALNLYKRAESYQYIHFPKNNLSLKNAERRIKFEEAFYFQLAMGLKKRFNKTNSIGNPFQIIGDHFNSFYSNYIPFQLTNAQKRVLKEIRNDLKKPFQMNRLLQGDVGSGKTMIALLSALIALDNGFQTCILAPTEILAQQHYSSFFELLKKTNISVELLTGSTKVSQRKTLHENLRNGELSILIGTHAVLEDSVQFKNLGLAIIDEQHRFGVAQRARLWVKNKIPPHILVMTATPIPRTLAMSFYSDLDVSIINEMPHGRKPIITVHRKDKDRDNLYNFCKEEIKKGRQVYFVYPLIEESEILDYKSLTEGYDHISTYFKNYKTGILHGKMSSIEKENVMKNFSCGSIQILVSTTVIEVGVNVPNASVMIIESAERFGLSQLHQLRGRVGRGSEQSYCILMTSDKLTNEGRKRIKTMCETNDGFKISEVDLQLRGPGDILGTQQSGILEFKKLDILHDSEIIHLAKRCIDKILTSDPYLNHPNHKIIKDYYMNNYNGKNKWAKIS